MYVGKRVVEVEVREGGRDGQGGVAGWSFIVPFFLLCGQHDD